MAQNVNFSKRRSFWSPPLLRLSSLLSVANRTQPKLSDTNLSLSLPLPLYIYVDSQSHALRKANSPIPFLFDLFVPHCRCSLKLPIPLAHRSTPPRLSRVTASMANNPSDGPTDDFFEQILGFPAYAPTDANLAGNSGTPMMLQLSSGDGSAHLGGGGGGGGGFHGSVFPLGLSLDQGKQGFREDVGDGRSSSSSMKNTFSGQPMPNTVSAMAHPPSIRPRVRARRGQATDPHSIAERLRRERIAERIRALQDLVPSVNKTDRAAMLDEIVEYVKFLRLQVKVLSMSRLGGAGAVAPLVTDIPISSLEQDAGESGRNQAAWEKWSNDGTEKQVAKLMEENVGAAMQFLQSKALCIMPISLASAIYHTQPPDATTVVKSESHPPS